MIKSVIFDLDGTLLDRDASLKKFVFHQHNRLGDLLGHINRSAYTKRFIELDQHGYVWKDKVYQQLIAEFGIEGVSGEQLLEDYLTHFPCHCVPFSNLISILGQLKKSNIALGMISNGFTEFQLANIRALGIEAYFDVILISEREGLRKPDQRIFIRALDQLGVDAKTAIFVGDHPKNDVEAAAQAGMKSIWKRNSQWPSANADFIIDGLAEIPVIVEALNSALEFDSKQ